MWFTALLPYNLWLFLKPGSLLERLESSLLVGCASEGSHRTHWRVSILWCFPKLFIFLPFLCPLLPEYSCLTSNITIPKKEWFKNHWYSKNNMICIWGFLFSLLLSLSFSIPLSLPCFLSFYVKLRIACIAFLSDHKSLKISFGRRLWFLLNNLTQYLLTCLYKCTFLLLLIQLSKYTAQTNWNLGPQNCHFLFWNSENNEFLWIRY